MQLSEMHTLMSSCFPITLEEMDSVNLMNRIDTRFVFSSDKLPAFFESLTEVEYIYQRDYIPKLSDIDIISLN